tara:strand:+ start:1185 stop:1985 length:801 start_codon:yes stop_codon:yes gene_type:complete
VTSDNDRVLIDAGLSYRAIQQRLDSLGLTADALRAVLITHAHVDHVRSAGMLSRKHGIPIYVTEATRAAWGEGAKKVADWKFLLPGRTVAFGAMQFVPFGVCHDADDTLGFRVNTPDGAIGFATDVGKITEDLISRFAACRVLVMESNHAVELLRVSPYAASVRSRIAGDDGHLSNEDVATFVRDHLGADVRCIVLAHLSRVNNVPEIAKMSCLDALCAVGREDVRVVVADQDRPTPTIDLASLSRYSARLAPTQSGLTQSDLPFA